MAGLIDAVSNMASDAMNRLQDENLDARELRTRNAQKQILSVIQVACVVASVAFTCFLALNPTLPLLIKTGILVGGLTEIYKVAGNFLECFTNGFTRLRADTTDQAFVKQLGKNTYVIGPLLNILAPHLFLRD